MIDRTHDPEDFDITVDRPDWDVDKVVSQVLAGLDGSVSESFVHQTVTTLFAEYDDAPVKLFVSVLVRREALDRLR